MNDEKDQEMPANAALAIKSQDDVNLSKGRSRRRHERVVVNTPFRAVIEETEHKGEVVDISSGGAALSAPPPVDNALFVQLHIDGHAPMNARVVRRFQEGYAVAFQLGQEAQAALDKKLKKLSGE